MTLRALPLRPGVVLDDTALAARGYAISSDKIRWHRGRAQPLGGYRVKASGLKGECRGLLEWADTAGSALLAIGTRCNLYVWRGGRILDITPERGAGTLGSDPLSTTQDSAVVRVTHPVHGARQGDVVYLRSLAAVGGVQVGGPSGTMPANAFQATQGGNRLTVAHPAHGLADNDIAYFTGATGFAGIPAGDLDIASGLRVQVVNADRYYVWVATAATSGGSGGGSPAFAYAKPYAAMVIDGNTYDVTAAVAASSTATGGGAAGAFSFNIPCGGAAAGGSAHGFGTGPFGAGPFGVGAGSTVPSAVRPRVWSLAAFGEDLIANIVGSSIYRWQSFNPSQRAALLENAPAQCNAVIVTPQRSILALGCTGTGGQFDPLIVRHCATELATVWTPAVTNDAGEERASEGTRLVGGLVTSRGTLVWTDTAAYEARFVGAFDQVYSLNIIAADAGLCAHWAAQESGGTTWWLDGSLVVRAYDGGQPRAVRSPIHQRLLDELDRNQIDKVYAFADRDFPAISWLYPRIGQMEPDRYVRFDHDEVNGDINAGWSVGSFDRTAWSTRRAFQYPFAVSAAGVLYEHEGEMGADGVPIDRHIEWAPMQLEDGEQIMRFRRFVLDAQRSEPIRVTFTAKKWPDAQEQVTRGPFTILPSTPYIDTKFSGRQVGFRLDATTAKSWRLGDVRGDLSEGPQR